MRIAPGICALLCALALPIGASAAIGIDEGPPSADSAAVQRSEFTEEGNAHYDKPRKFGFADQKRAQMEDQVRGIVMIVAPVALIVLLTFLYVRSRSEGGRRRSTHRKLKQAEVRRRTGAPEQMLDPRRW